MVKNTRRHRRNRRNTRKSQMRKAKRMQGGGYPTVFVEHCNGLGGVINREGKCCREEDETDWLGRKTGNKKLVCKSEKEMLM